MIEGETDGSTDLTLSSSSVSSSLVRWSIASSISESNSRPERDSTLVIFGKVLNLWHSPTLLGVYCISPACCASEVSTEAAVICRLELFSVRAENVMLHRDGRKAKNTLSSNVAGWNTERNRPLYDKLSQYKNIQTHIVTSWLNVKKH